MENRTRHARGPVQNITSVTQVTSHCQRGKALAIVQSVIKRHFLRDQGVTFLWRHLWMSFFVNKKFALDCRCAPECITFLKFTSSSDVWAFGVTLWEMFSYGFQPWAAQTGQQILEAIDEPNCQRLDQPLHSPAEFYSIMQQCWRHGKKK